MKLSNKVYDTIKWLVLIFLPAFTTFVATIGQAFNWTFLPEVLTIITAFTAFLGTLVGVSSANYKGAQTNDTKVQ